MIQDRVLKIIKGLNTFSLYDIIVMTGFEEYEVYNIIEQLVKDRTIIQTPHNEYNFVSKIPERKRTLQLIEKPRIQIMPDNNINFKQAAEYFLANHASINCTPSSFKTYISITKTHLITFFGKMNLKYITQKEIMEFIDLKQKEGLTNKRIRNCITLFGNMLSKFIEWRFISNSPYNGIINVKFSREQKIQILKTSEVNSLLKTAKANYYKLYPFILLILSTGLKKAEILALKKEDINLKNRKITINKTFYEGEILIPKVKTVIRQVDIPEYVILELKKMMKNKQEEDFIFYDTSISHFTSGKHIRQGFAALLKQLNLPKITFNELRHTYACTALQKGMSIDYLHKQLGDYSIQSTMDKYRDFISNQ